MELDDLFAFGFIYLFFGAGTLAIYDENAIPTKTKLQVLKNTSVVIFWPIFLVQIILKKLYNYWTSLPDE